MDVVPEKINSDDIFRIHSKKTEDKFTFVDSVNNEISQSPYSYSTQTKSPNKDSWLEMKNAGQDSKPC